MRAEKILEVSSRVNGSHQTSKVIYLDTLTSKETNRSDNFRSIALSTNRTQKKLELNEIYKILMNRK
jgi:hypothetical protein